MNQEKINRINELYKKQKAGTITPEEKDCTAVLLIAPIGLYMLFSKQIVIL